VAGELEYLGRNLNSRAYDAAGAAERALTQVMAKAAAAGALASGRTLLLFEEEALRVFTEKVTDAIQFAFNLTERNTEDVLAPVRFCVGRMAEMINAHVVTYSTRLGIQEHTTAGQVHKIRQAIEERKMQLLDDFAHGMMGSDRMKKDPVISVVNTQTNSPGATQQTGFGNFSQAAFAQQHQPLIAAIDRAISSPEFAALQPAEKDAFRDIADTLKDEGAKRTPNAGKLERWGSRLVELGRELGLRVATSEITTVLQNIFGGG
jgi:hypothetical protein